MWQVMKIASRMVLGVIIAGLAVTTYLSWVLPFSWLEIAQYSFYGALSVWIIADVKAVMEFNKQT